MKQIDWQKIWGKAKVYVLNKYILTVFIFAVVIGFVGEQSIRVRIKKARQIHELEEKKARYCEGIEEANRTIQMLQSTDSLERYAREKYLMHTDEEDVFLIEE